MKQATVTGCLTTHRDGYGFVAADDGGGDIFIPARYLRDNLHGDVVRVRVQAQGTAGKREGRIVETVEPFRGNLVGRISARGAHVVFIPDEQRITAEIVVAPGEMHGAVGGDIVVAALTAHPAGGRPAQARILEVLGKPDDSGVSFLRIARKYGLSSEFPPEVRAELRGLPTVIDGRELQGRRDLRQITTVTIDGETARDFDDAVAVRREMHDMIRLWVSIADVSHYVAPGSALDREAFTRGTSVYFPGYCIPMLPEELSNGTCSLNPREERLTVTVELLIDAEGIVRETDFYPSVIV
ncbi:RNB domain-containing ribonuclease, partial [bacterium]